jgi:hypothetical protein
MSFSIPITDNGRCLTLVPSDMFEVKKIPNVPAVRAPNRKSLFERFFASWKASGISAS